MHCSRKALSFSTSRFYLLNSYYDVHMLAYPCWGKRCQIVKDVLRLTKEGISDCVMEIACSLHNLRVSFGKPIQDFDLLNLLNLG